MTERTKRGAMKLDATIRLRPYSIISEAVETAIAYGYRRAHKSHRQPGRRRDDRGHRHGCDERPVRAARLRRPMTTDWQVATVQGAYGRQGTLEIYNMATCACCQAKTLCLVSCTCGGEYCDIAICKPCIDMSFRHYNDHYGLLR